MHTDSYSDDSPAVCGWYISYLYRKSGTFFTAQLKKIGLSAMQSVLLIGIYRHEGTDQSALEEDISILPSVGTRILRELEDKGYLIKERDSQNRRNYNLFLTAAGRDMAEQSLAIQQAYWEQVLEAFTPEETETLNLLLSKMEDRVVCINPDAAP